MRIVVPTSIIIGVEIDIVIYHRLGQHVGVSFAVNASTEYAQVPPGMIVLGGVRGQHKSNIRFVTLALTIE